MQGRNLLVAFGVLIAVFVVGFGFVYFGGAKPGRTPVSSPSPAAVSLTSENITAQEGEVREITVEGDEYKFNPGELSFNKGEKVKLTFTNTGKLPHNLTIDELGVATDTIPGGKSTMLEFTVGKTGTFKSYCSVGNHRALGMEGDVGVR